MEGRKGLQRTLRSSGTRFDAHRHGLLLRFCGAAQSSRTTREASRGHARESGFQAEASGGLQPRIRIRLLQRALDQEIQICWRE